MKTLERVCSAVLALVVCLPVAWSQQVDQTGNPPAVPAQSSGATGAQGVSGAQAEPNALQPDTRSLSGAEEISLGTRSGERSYLLPSFSLSQVGDSNGQLATGASGFDTATIPLFQVSLNRVGARQQFIANYQGGGIIYETQSGFNATFHQLSLSEKVDLRHWELSLGDYFSYLPEAAFGFGGIGLGGASDFGAQLGLGGSLGQLNPFFLPSQSILTTRVASFSNAAVTEAHYSYSARSSVTFAGSFDLLRYRKRGFLDTNEVVLLGGFDHAYTARDTFAFNYGFSAFRFPGAPQSVEAHSVQLGYGRRLTGRLALKLLAGPQVILVRFQGKSLDPRVFLSSQDTLQYAFARGSIDLSYQQYATGGSGIFAGARSQVASVGLSRQLARVWTTELTLGYSRNARLGVLVGGSSSNRVFDYEFGSVRLNRTCGRYIQAFVLYNLQRETSDQAFFGGSSGGKNLLRHTFGVGLTVHTRPFNI